MLEMLPIILFFVAFKFLAVLLCGAAKVSVIRSAGVGDETLRLLLSARRETLDLSALTATVPERGIRIADAVGRKGMHIVFFLVSMIGVQVLAVDHNAAVAAGITVGIVTLIAMVLLYRSDSWLGRTLFAPYARVMDGRRARLNMLSAQSLGTVQAVLLASLAYLDLLGQVDERYAYALMYAVYLPVALGDTMGEIVGAGWGRHRLRVLGIGETNRKSVAGTLAVFLTTLGSLLLVSVTVPSPEGFAWLAVVVAVVTTITELAAPRSTDSFFIPVINAAVAGAWFAF